MARIAHCRDSLHSTFLGKMPIMKHRILIVEDETDLAELLHEFLESEFDPVTFTDSRAALAAFQSSNFDLVMTDLTMPDLSGKQLITAIKAINPDIPILIITGRSGSDRDTQEAMALGCQGALIKPLPAPSQIIAIVKEHLKPRHQDS